MRKPILAAVAALAMFSVSGNALAQSAAPLSLSAHAPAGADLQQPNDIRGGFILPTLAILAIIGVVYLLTKNDKPASP